MSTDTNKAIVRRFIDEIFVGGRKEKTNDFGRAALPLAVSLRTGAGCA